MRRRSKRKEKKNNLHVYPRRAIVLLGREQMQINLMACVV